MFDWRKVVAENPEEVEAISKFCGSLCYARHEAFAEGYSAYFACDLSLQWTLEFMPNMAKVYQALEYHGIEITQEIVDAE